MSKDVVKVDVQISIDDQTSELHWQVDLEDWIGVSPLSENLVRLEEAIRRGIDNDLISLVSKAKSGGLTHRNSQSAGW